MGGSSNVVDALSHRHQASSEKEEKAEIGEGSLRSLRPQEFCGEATLSYTNNNAMRTSLISWHPVVVAIHGFRSVVNVLVAPEKSFDG